MCSDNRGTSSGGRTDAYGRGVDTVRQRVELIEAIHATPPLAVVAVTGGGVLATADLLSVPGASRTVLEVRVPYAASALADLVGAAALGRIAQAVSSDAAEAMAGACRQRAAFLAPEATVPLLGVACTAALASDRPKRGEHRAFVAHDGGASDEGGDGPHVWSLSLDKGTRSRLDEDRLVSDLLLVVLARACGVEASWPEIGPGDRFVRTR
jgi:hypothetical protein